MNYKKLKEKRILTITKRKEALEARKDRPPVDVREVELHLTKGATVRELVSIFNVSKQRIHQLIDKFNLPKPLKQFDRDWPSSKLDAFRRAIENRATDEELSKVFGVSKHTVTYVKEYMGFRKKVDRTGLSLNEGLVNQRLINARRRSRLPSNIRLQDLLPLPELCPVFGTPLVYRLNTPGFRNPNIFSLDQVDPGKGYIKGNVQIISERANRLKDNGSALEHRLIAEYIEKYKIPLIG